MQEKNVIVVELPEQLQDWHFAKCPTNPQPGEPFCLVLDHGAVPVPRRYRVPRPKPTLVGELKA